MTDEIQQLKISLAEGLTLYEDLMARMSNAFRGRIRHKPILGPSAGMGGISIGSFHSVERGLDVVFYVVIHDSTETVLGGGYTKADAIDAYRFYVRRAGAARAAAHCAKVHAEWESAQALKRAALQDSIRQGLETGSPRPKQIPKRRQRIFDESGGKCHYCATPLTLDGKWHIEHKMPRALLGGNEPENLVAACVPCNSKKRDRTDVEFIASRSAA